MYSRIANIGSDIWSQLVTFWLLLRERGFVQALRRITVLTSGMILLWRATQRAAWEELRTGGVAKSNQDSG